MALRRESPREKTIRRENSAVERTASLRDLRGENVFVEITAFWRGDRRGEPGSRAAQESDSCKLELVDV
jgi:hypothetical protein